jgi:hypothetical protein
MPAERRRRRHARNGRTHDSAGKKRGLAQCQGEASLRKLAGSRPLTAVNSPGAVKVTA